MKRALFVLLLMPTVVWGRGDREEPAPQETPNVDVRVDNPVTVESPVTVDVPVDVTTPVDARTDVSVPVEVNNQNNTEIVNPDDIKVRNTPSIGLATPSDSIGFTFAIPGFATGVNLPWSFGDRKLLPVYDRLIADGDDEAATIVMCMTSVMKKAFEDPEACKTSLGGGSIPTGKSEETVYETASGPPSTLLLAEVEHEEHERLKKELAEAQAQLKAQAKQLDELEAEVGRRDQAYRTVQSRIEEAEQSEEEVQAELDEFLKSLEARKKK